MTTFYFDSIGTVYRYIYLYITFYTTLAFNRFKIVFVDNTKQCVTYTRFKHVLLNTNLEEYF